MPAPTPASPRHNPGTPKLSWSHSRHITACMPQLLWRQADRDTEIGQYLACGQSFGYRLPYLGETALDQAQDSEGDHGQRKHRMTHACDEHRSAVAAVGDSRHCFLYDRAERRAVVSVQPLSSQCGRSLARLL